MGNLDFSSYKMMKPFHNTKSLFPASLPRHPSSEIECKSVDNRKKIWELQRKMNNDFQTIHYRKLLYDFELLLWCFFVILKLNRSLSLLFICKKIYKKMWLEYYSIYFVSCKKIHVLETSDLKKIHLWKQKWWEKLICSIAFLDTEHSQFCEAEGLWPIAKSGYDAILHCDNSAVGLRKRKCEINTWQKEISTCVNEDLHSIKKDIEVSFFGIHNHLLVRHCWTDLLSTNSLFCFTFIITDIN